MSITIQIGVGEAFDRLSILKIKLIEIKNESKLANIKKEHDYLESEILKIDEKEGIVTLYESLYDVNYDLWDVEDELRLMERANVFDGDFIENARSVYKLNDKRAKIKREINELYSSDFIEEKSYQEY